MTSGTPEEKQMRAASGSASMLNSAAGVTFPFPTDPPMRTIRPMREEMSGASRSAMARLVMGPVVTTVTGSSEPRRCSIRNSTACFCSGSFVHSGKTGPSSPVSPWISPAMTGSRTNGPGQPAYTGMPVLPIHCRTLQALSVVFGSVWLPATVVTASRTMRGLFAASMIAVASSCPGSQSRTMCVSFCMDRSHLLAGWGNYIIKRDGSGKDGCAAARLSCILKREQQPEG